MSYQFTADYVTSHEKTWRKFLDPYIGFPDIQLLEIGSFEGRSTVWFLENILTHEDSRITCVDHNFRGNFYRNVADFSEKVSLCSGDSQVILRDKRFLEPRFDIIYVDGSHAAPHVIEDAILSFSSLKTGGIMIFDDYLWKVTPYLSGKSLTEEEILRQQPKMAIDAFVDIFHDSIEVLYKQYQVILRKIENKVF